VRTRAHCTYPWGNLDVDQHLGREEQQPRCKDIERVKMYQGSCLCGSIKYSIDDNLKWIVNCHCRFCSKAHGAAFTTLLMMPFNRLQVLEGQTLLSSYEVKTLNSLRMFCSQCGTRLYNHSPSKGMISLVVATLDTDAKLRPIANINVASKCSWHQITDELPQYNSSPSAAEFGQLLSG
jgi:hypothetical protein